MFRGPIAVVIGIIRELLGNFDTKRKVSMLVHIPIELHTFSQAWNLMNV